MICAWVRLALSLPAVGVDGYSTSAKWPRPFFICNRQKCLGVTTKGVRPVPKRGLGGLISPESPPGVFLVAAGPPRQQACIESQPQTRRWAPRPKGLSLCCATVFLDSQGTPQRKALRKSRRGGGVAPPSSHSAGVPLGRNGPWCQEVISTAREIYISQATLFLYPVAKKWNRPENVH